MKIVKPVILGMLTATTVLGAGALSVSAYEGDSAANSVRSTVRSTFGLADNNETDPENPINPEIPGEPGGENPGGGGPAGPLRIDYASNFSFGEIEFDPVTGGSGYALADTWVNGESTEKIPNFVQVSDNRGNNTGWTLTVAQTDQLRIGEDGPELRGAEITLGNIEAENRSRSNDPWSADSITLNPGTQNAVVVARANATDPESLADTIGIGTNIIRFGNDNTAGSSINLDVPGGMSVVEGANYATTFEWTLHNTPHVGSENGE